MSKNMSKTKKQINDEWNELYQYVKHDILKYEDKVLPKHFVLRLKGLSEGKFMSNKNSKSNANYEFTDILMTFKINKYKILNALHNNEFKDERHMINYIMIIIENDINNIVAIIDRKNKSELKCAEVEVQAIDNNIKADYIKRTKTNTNKRIEELW